MHTNDSAEAVHPLSGVRDHPSIPADQVLGQLERLAASSHFRNSKRYPALLRFIVAETLAGRADSLKERTLGIEVFGRPHDYDTNADPVVRVSAGEVRKRIAQYYQTPGNEQEVRFDLPLGSYAPLFLAPRHTLALEVNEPAASAAQASATSTVGPFHEAVEAAFSTAAVAEPSAIHLLPDTPATPQPAASRWRTALSFFIGRNALRASVVFVLVLLGCSALLLRALATPQPTSQPVNTDALTTFWGPLLQSKEPILFVVGVHSFDRQGHDLSPANSIASNAKSQSMLSSMISSDMVSISDLIAYNDMTRLLDHETHGYKTQSSVSTTFDDLRRGPIVLIGGFNNLWTQRLTAKLRFHMVSAPDSVNEIADSERPDVRWRFDTKLNSLSTTRDYAIVASSFDEQIEQPVLIVAGIGKNGTQAAAEFLTGENYLKSWLAHAHAAHHDNVELVLATEVFEGKNGPPQIVASTEW